MKTLTWTKIACHMTVLMIVLVFLLQDTMTKMKMTLVLAIYKCRCIGETCVWPSDLNDWIHPLKPLPEHIPMRR